MTANMTERLTLRWQPISYELYSAIFKELGGGSMRGNIGKWGCFASYTSCNEDNDQMTEWGLGNANESLLKNESKGGKHFYWLKVPA